MKFLVRQSLLFLCTAITISAANLSKPAAGPTVDQIFERIYSFDFEGGLALAGRYIASNRHDPMGYAAKASAFLFSELNRLNALGSGSLSEEKVRGGKALEPDPGVRRQFQQTIDEAERLAEGMLKSNPQEMRGLLALAVTSGLQRDYAALIDKKYRRSMEYIKLAQSYSSRLLAADPSAHDAYLNTGFSEYLIGSFPAPLRWVVKVDGVEGNKDKGLSQMAITAKSGRYMKGFAQLLLANFYRKEKRIFESERMLRLLAANYPDNPVIRRELEKLHNTSD